MYKLILTLFCAMTATPAAAVDMVSQHVPNASTVGSGNLSIALWNVYDATLYAQNGRWNANQPFALQLQYHRDIKGVDIADRSAEEIRKLGLNDEIKLAAWHSQMRKLFPDVGPGTKLVGVYQPDGAALFYKDGQPLGTIQDPEFGRWFFDIWLSDHTTEPELRAALLGKR